MERAVLTLQDSNQPAVQPGILRRACACGLHTSGSGCSECEKKNHSLMRRESNPSADRSVPSIVHQVLRTAGQPLDSSTRARMEPRFGQVGTNIRKESSRNSQLVIGDPHDASEAQAETIADRITTGFETEQRPGVDFSGVRIHSDNEAAKSAEAVNALAYTVGRHIVFNRDQYHPGTSAGSKLLAHELTHVVQQSGIAGGPACGEQSMAQRSGVLARDPKPAAPDPGFSDAPMGGQNEFVVTVDDKGNIIKGKDPGKGVWRVPVEGLTHGLQKGSKGPAFESSEKRAVALIPNTVSPAKSPKPDKSAKPDVFTVDVLLHLHGHGVGYRELRPKEKDAPGVLKPGELRDIALYEAEQQLLRHVNSTKRLVIAILPQGTERSNFGDLSSNSDAYIKEVIAKLIPKFLPAGTIPGRLIVSGHSGGGPTAMSIAGKSTGRTDVLLFDAINFACTEKEKIKQGDKEIEKCKEGSECASNEFGTVKKFVRKKISDDVDNLVGLPDDKMPAALQTNGTRFRGFTSASLDTKSTCSYGHWYNLLKQDIETTIKSQKVVDPVKDELRKNYVVQQVRGPHEKVMGQGNLETALKD